MDLNASLNEKWRGGTYQSVILVGHSFGALACRQAYLFALGQEPNVSAPSEWGLHVERLVLFAGISRGIDWASGPVRYRVMNRVMHLWPARGHNWLSHEIQAWRDVTRGSAFLTNLRIQWIRRFDKAEREGRATPRIVQFLGTRDALVSRKDSIDVERFDRTVHIDLAGADHRSLVQPETAPDPEARYALIRSSLLSDDVADEGEGAKAENRTYEGAARVLFLTHGIRANAFEWPGALKVRVQKLDPKIRVVTPTAGYFSAFRFAFPPTRWRNLQLFRDRYTQALARNPRARFDYIGHSNGTYLLGQNLKLVPGMRFDSVILAASVLPPDYDWSSRFDACQVRRVRADYAARDVPVGLLCSALRAAWMRDVGPGGFEGFYDEHPNLTKVGWYDGGHGKMLEEQNLDALLSFVLTDDFAGEPTAMPLLTTPMPWIRGLMRWAGLLLVLILGSLVGIGAWIARVVADGSLSWAGAIGLATAVVLLLLILILDRF